MQSNILMLDDDIPPPPSYEPETPMIKIEIRFLSGRPLTMDLEEGFHCRVMKLRIADARGIPVQNQTLVFNGGVLNDDLTLRSSGLTMGAQIYCLNVMPEENKAVVGVPADNLQVDCPTCGILIAVPPDMFQFQCPRCSTICSAPPKYTAPVAAKRAAKPPVSSSSLAAEVAKKRQLRLQAEAQSQAAAAMGHGTASGLPPPGSVVEIPTVTSTPINVAARNQDVKSPVSTGTGHVAGLTTKEDQFIQQVITSDVTTEIESNDKRLRLINYPYGTDWLGFRSFLLMQCPIVNLWWLWEMCRIPPRDQRFPFGVDWFDCDTAKHGLIVGVMVFFFWFPFFIWGCVGLVSGGLIGSILGTFFGPLILLACCWDPECQRQCCNNCCNGSSGSHSGSCDCDCGSSSGNTCDCDCRGCDHACDDCCKNCDCCEACCKGCGDCNCGNCNCDCNCSGCDCGGCDC